jgi:protein-tyrosine-phosphatase
MAQLLAESVLAELIGCTPADLPDLNIRIASAGTFAALGRPASPEAVHALAQRGLDLSQHRSQPLTADLLRQADLVLTMTHEHKEFACELVADTQHRVELLHSRGAVPDPIGQPASVYVDCADTLERLIRERFRKLVQ